MDIKMENAVATIEYVGIQGKWGWYPCDHATYLKLKRLNMLVTEHLRVQSKHERWANKAPQNRFQRRWNRNATGQKISFTIGEAIPEPKKGYAPFNARIKVAAWQTVPFSSIINEHYRKARYPAKTKEAVTRLEIRPHELDALLAEAEAWAKA